MPTAARPTPRPVELGEERVDRLAGDVAVDERLRQPLGDDRWRLDGLGADRGEAEAERERLRPVGRERDPGADPAVLGAGALDERAARLEPAQHARPGGGDLGLVVLTEHIHRPDDRGTPVARQRHLEASEAEPDPGPGAFARDPHALRVDLDPDDLDLGTHHGEPVGEFEGRRRGRPVAEVDDERIGRRAERRELRDPAVDPAEPVHAGRPARDSSHRLHTPILPSLFRMQRRVEGTDRRKTPIHPEKGGAPRLGA